MRVFVAVWPSEPAVAALAALPRPAIPHLRWTTPAQWHVTLAFLGDVDAHAVVALQDALEAAAGAASPSRAVLGPATTRIGRAVLCLPAQGLDALAAGVRSATSAAGFDPVTGGGAGGAFRGHCTLARASGRRAVPPALTGVALATAWAVTDVCLVRSTLDPAGARYETLVSATVPS